MKINEGIVDKKDKVCVIPPLLHSPLSSKYQMPSSIIEKDSGIWYKQPFFAVLGTHHTRPPTACLSCSFMIRLIDAGVLVRAANQSPVRHLNCLLCL